jgi:hypothetical protein
VLLTLGYSEYICNNSVKSVVLSVTAMSSDLVVRGLASGLLAMSLLMGKSCRQSRKINPYVRLYLMGTGKDCKCNIFVSSSLAKQASWCSILFFRVCWQGKISKSLSVFISQPFCSQLLLLLLLLLPLTTAATF